MRYLSFLTLATAALGLSLPKKRSTLWDYANDKVQGVNLGGWFVLEPYITPSLFEKFDEVPVDEYHFTQALGKDQALKVLQNHWLSWYTEDDFKAIKQAGLNHVRIPIGYWAFRLLDDDPYVQGQVEYLDQAIEWARNNDLKVWVDLHGAPGSQNGFDNSGLRDEIGFQSSNNIEVTLTALQDIFDKYGGWDYEDVITGIELLNEPLGPSADLNQLKNFYQWGYKNMRSVSVNNVIIHDAFMPYNYWDKELTSNGGYWDVILDHHHYQVFSSGELSRSIDDHISVACSWGTGAKSEYHWNVAGEFSAALTDCAYWLNGVNRGARWEGNYDGSSYHGLCDSYVSVDLWTDSHKSDVRKYLEAQLDAFEQTAGWIFWNWKCEDAIDWDLSKLIDAGVFPQPLNDRQYPNQCGF
ncbi:CIC11C00000005718 [Sungouiella intermedia]|uniref:Glucan 1,3-beta-glucosidase n=1 Tax=Sungouiella intermedia TaxID=45354 RepID=A0A1L0BUL5_9ASCO|nr:CIC11C00000002079 [[Candida] intermedia]SGZ53994.1 CIC11C00000005718 [[Candida] intermedia]